jgi:hypothetical protein
MLENKISAIISQQDLTDITNAINLINTKMPFLLGLDEDERKTLLKINNSNKTFSEDVVRVWPTVSAYLPAYLNKTELEKDLNLFNALDNVRILLESLTAKVTDTQIMAGNETYNVSLIAYRSIATAARSSQPGAQGAYDQLAPRFQKASKKAPQPQK